MHHVEVREGAVQWWAMATSLESWRVEGATCCLTGFKVSFWAMLLFWFYLYFFFVFV